jgi:hypothetical protein
MRVRTQGTPPSPRHMLAMSPYFYLNELLVQVIRTPLGKHAKYPLVLRLVAPFRVSLCVCRCISPEDLLRLYPS